MTNKTIIERPTETIQKAFAGHGLFYSETYGETGKGGFKVCSYQFMVHSEKDGKKERIYFREEKGKGLMPDELHSIRTSMLNEVLKECIEKISDQQTTHNATE